jgi:flavin reductase (DIM6/NTAB) family NADH-FMN oxidoreductase RutF
VPEEKRARFRFEAAKFEAAELTAQPSETVGPPRVQECPLQLEAEVASLRDLVDVGAVVVEATVTRVHAAPGIVVEGTSHVDPRRRRPLLYVFRHYVAASEHLGKTFRAEA